MAIRVQPSGYGAAVFGLAQLAGEARAEQENIERLERAAENARQRAFQKEMADLRHQWDIEAFNREQAWNIEKMELASRADFMRDEQRRQRELDELDAKKKAIRDSTVLSEEEKALWLVQVETDLPLVSEKRLSKKAAEQSIKRTDVDAAVKFLTEYREKYPAEYGASWWKPESWRDRPTEEEKTARVYYEDILERAGIPFVSGSETFKPDYSLTGEKKTHSVGDIITKGGKKWKVVGYTPDGKTRVVEVPTSTTTTTENIYEQYPGFKSTAF